MGHGIVGATGNLPGEECADGTGSTDGLTWCRVESWTCELVAGQRAATDMCGTIRHRSLAARSCVHAPATSQMAQSTQQRLRHSEKREP